MVAVASMMISAIVKKPSLKDPINKCDAEAVKKALDEGADANETWTSFSAIGWASMQTNCEIMKVLIDKGADVNYKSGIFGTALCKVVEDESCEPSKRVEANYKSLTAMLKHFKDTAELIEKGYWNKRYTDIKTYSPIVDRVKLLVASGADVNAPNGSNSSTAFLAAVRLKKHEVVKALLASGKADFESRENQFKTNLGKISDWGAAYKYEKGSRATVRDWSKLPSENNALLDACENNDLDMVKILVEANANVNCIKKAFTTSSMGEKNWLIGPLDIATSKKSVEMVDYLKSKGAERMNDQ